MTFEMRAQRLDAGVSILGEVDPVANSHAAPVGRKADLLTPRPKVMTRTFVHDYLSTQVRMRPLQVHGGGEQKHKKNGDVTDTFDSGAAQKPNLKCEASLY